MTKPKKRPITAPSAEKRFEQAAFTLTRESVELVRLVEKHYQRPEKLGLSASQVEDVHLTLRASSLGLLSVLSVLSGHPDPRQQIENGDLP